MIIDEHHEYQQQSSNCVVNVTNLCTHVQVHVKSKTKMKTVYRHLSTDSIIQTYQNNALLHLPSISC